MNGKPLIKLAVAAGGLLVFAACSAQGQRLCASKPVPPGWVIVDELLEAASCGGSSIHASNVFIIERFDNRPKGATMLICRVASTPSGWSLVREVANPAKCFGIPTNGRTNMFEIRRDR